MIFYALRTDIKFQFKHGFYIIYAVLTLFYMIVLSRVPENYLSFVVPVVVYLDPSFLGMFFIGGIIMLEKQQGVIQTITVTPLRLDTYLLSKCISLTTISLVAGIAVTLVSFGAGINWMLFVIGIILTSIMYTSIGLMISGYCKTVNHYLIKSTPFIILLIIPCLSLIGYVNVYFFLWIPSVASLKLLAGSFQQMKTLEGVLLVSYLTLIDYLLLIWVRKVFEKKVIYRG